MDELGRGEVHKKGAQWRCRRSCGVVRVLRADSLRSGATRSCGYLRKELSTVRDIRERILKEKHIMS